MSGQWTDSFVNNRMVLSTTACLAVVVSQTCDYPPWCASCTLVMCCIHEMCVCAPMHVLYLTGVCNPAPISCVITCTRNLYPM